MTAPYIYFQDEMTTLYCGRAEEVLPMIEAVDLVLCDPQYGIDYNPSGGNGVARRGNLPRVTGDNKPFDPSHLLHYPRMILWGANHYAHKLPPSPSWLVWYKRDRMPSIDFADCELAWTNLPIPARVFNHMWHGMLRDSEQGEKRLHPTQKPLALMRWCIQLAGPTIETVGDFYCGSGTTLRAAKDLGIKTIGIEIEERYCEIAVQRLAQQVIPFDLPPTPTAQQSGELFSEVE